MNTLPFPTRPSETKKKASPPIRKLIWLGTLAASSHNTQPWKFQSTRNSITIFPDFSRRCPVVDPTDAHLFKSLGCAAENITQGAEAEGFQSVVTLKEEPTRVTISFTSNPFIQKKAVPVALKRRHCVKGQYDGVPLWPYQLFELAQAGVGEGVRTLFLSEPEELETVASLVTQGNTTQLNDPAFRQELFSWIRYNEREATRKGDGLSGKCSSSPSMPSWLGRRLIPHLVSAERQAAKDARYILSSSGVAIFISTRNDRAAWVEAGRTCQRFLLKAHEDNVQVAFINQPIEVNALRPKLESWLGLEGEHAQLMVRYGHGKAAPLSHRRPLQEVLITT